MPDLAVIMGGPESSPESSRKPPMGDSEMGEGEAPIGEESNGAFDSAYEEMMDESLPPEDRKAAFRRAIMACMGEDY